MDSLNLRRQRELQDYRKVLCELGVTVKKNVGKLAGRLGRTGKNLRENLVIYERQVLCDSGKGESHPHLASR